jgi:release factor glutamine methyltransferase
MDPVSLALYRECEALLATSLQTLNDKPEETLTSTLSALWHAAAGKPLSVQRATDSPLPALDVNASVQLRTLLQQRIAGTPLAHLTGRQQFMGLELQVSGDALIPREETELLGHAALTHLKNMIREKNSATVIDVCTGSGNLALALAHHAPGARVWAADLSESAVALAERNAKNLSLDDRVTFRAGDLLAPFDTPEFHGKVDLLVCNPPYISSGKVDVMASEIIGHEPRLAFDGGPLGIRILQRLIAEAPRFLKANGVLAFEIGLGQARGIRKRLEQHGDYVNIEEIADAKGDTRALVATWTPHEPAWQTQGDDPLK